VRRRGLGTVLVSFGTTLAVILFNATVLGDPFWRRILYPIDRQLWWDVPHTWLGELGWRTVRELVHAFADHLFVAPVVASFALLAIVIARGVAAARLRAGSADPLDRLRQRPRLVRALTWLPAALFSFPWVVEAIYSLTRIGRDGLHLSLEYALSSLLAAGVIGAIAYLVGRAGVRSLLAPVETDETAPKDPGEIVFSAVAVTTRTRAAVAALAAASVAMVAWAIAAPSYDAFPWALAAYVAAAMSAPFALRRVSRIAVGLDGVWVRDASRAIFFAYRDLEGARARGADLELVAKGGRRTVLRLQMHGDDAGRRDEVLARVQDAIARSRAGDTRGAEMLVQAMPTRHVVASAGGDARYRLPSISREQLWDLVESPATDASTRTAAAEALAIHIDGADRTRLRVAAEQCAEPRVRVALAALAEEDAAVAAAAADAEEEASAAQR